MRPRLVCGVIGVGGTATSRVQTGLVDFKEFLTCRCMYNECVRHLTPKGRPNIWGTKKHPTPPATHYSPAVPVTLCVDRDYR
jgi:squalene cyclase